jgi:hypothetical protein
MAACVDGDVDSVTRLLDKGASVDVQDDEGYTALHLAVLWNHRNPIDFLLTRGADPNIVNRHGNGPLWAAVMEPKVGNEIIESLIDAGADAFQANAAGFSPIELAKEIGQGLETPFAGLKPGGNRVNRPPYQRQDRNCPDCSAQPNDLHEPFCLKERCPFCGEQLATCDCIFEILDLNDEERAVVEASVDDSVEALTSIGERWSAALNSKGRVPW